MAVTGIGQRLGRLARRPRLLLPAAAALAVLGLVAALTKDSDDPAGIQSFYRDAPPAVHVAPQRVPTGFALDRAFRGPLDAGPLRNGFVVVYVEGTAADPLAAGALIATTVEESGLDPAAGEAVTVQGGPGSVYASPGRGGLVVSWKDGAAVLRTLTGIGVDREALLAAAEAVDDEGSVPEAALPDGFEELGRDTLPALVSFDRGLVLDGPGSGTVTYGGADSRRIIVSAGPGGQRRVDLLRPFLERVTNLDVGGVLALAGELEGASVVTWASRDTVVRVTAFGLTLPEVAAVAGDLRELTDDEFDDLVAGAA